MALSEIDRNLLQRCLAHKPKAWHEFVDRFMGLVVHVVNHTAQCRSIRMTKEDRDDLAADVFLAFIKDDYGILRRFRGESSLATYLTVIARRVVVHQLVGRKSTTPLGGAADQFASDAADPEQRISNREEVERLLDELQGTEATIVRMYHLEGQSYRQISEAMGVPENSIGPTLSRAREKMRRAGADQAASSHE